ncbi:hypothetical protein [Prochlorococcus marinus]|uniref:hypothetical protein n=1 Tax=Prochlorococcus marinus TaxID=1219 RepID=UPI001F4D0966|nr:hypothetical protein [Prochlorococcus marinus]
MIVEIIQIKKFFPLIYEYVFNKVLDQQDLKLSKKLITSYKKRLEKEILDRSMKLRMPQNKFAEIIDNNNELINLKQALKKLEAETEPHS